MSKIPNKKSNKTGERSIEERPPSAPRWVKVSGIIVIVLALLIVLIMFISGGEHGPGRHLSEDEPGKHIKQEDTGEYLPLRIGLL